MADHGGLLNVGFFSCGEGPHADLAANMIASARRVMDCRVVHLTDDKTPGLGGAVIRLSGDMPLVNRRIALYGALKGEWCLVDTDVVFQQDVRSVFDHSFDIAVVERAPETKGCDYGKLVPYNLGVVFSRCPEFWQAMLPALQKLPQRLQEWDGGQFLMSYMARRNLFDVKVLPCSYNFTPQAKDEDVSQHAIVHYKGKKKDWIAGAHR